MDMLEEKVSEERDLDLNKEVDIRMEYIREEHWRYVSENGKDKKKIYALKWEVYKREKE